MRFMLDTCAFIDAATDFERLGRDVRSIIEDADNEICVSIETVREVIQKYKTREVWGDKWKEAEDILRSIHEEMYFTVLPIDERTVQTYASLDLNTAEGHKDPFDHIIIAHALTMRMPLVSRDHKFGFYRRQGLDLIYYGRQPLA